MWLSLWSVGRGEGEVFAKLPQAQVVVLIQKGGNWLVLEQVAFPDFDLLTLDLYLDLVAGQERVRS
jgi:hypothetical protein